MTQAGLDLSPALADYLLTIRRILSNAHVARVKEIAIDAGVSMASVTPALKRLARMGLVEYRARAFVALTARGQATARRVQVRHELVERFLRDALGVSREQAASDACVAGHHLSDEAIDRIVRWLERRSGRDHRRLSEMAPGERGELVYLNGSSPMRLLMVNKGLLPGVAVTVLREEPNGDDVWVDCNGEEILLSAREVETVIVSARVSGSGS